MQRNVEALQCYDRILETDTRDARAWYRKGMVLKVMDHLPESLDAFEKAVSFDPQFGVAHLERALLLQVQEEKMKHSMPTNRQSKVILSWSSHFTVKAEFSKRRGTAKRLLGIRGCPPEGYRAYRGSLSQRPDAGAA
jgi:tetratricopeptide (TPR) repeat protein